ncbi:MULTISPECIES: hypothetical protein [Pedobacter]|uniref:hypothetical protein n=1 Tax=Pedobacter TaxID=84567 RepID=UPI00292D65A9|nr:hypothetical protein [Pedobacter aquatilis]
MLKYISYLNLFLGIIFIAIFKSSENYLDLALIIPSIFFNWVTLFHFIKNSQKFEKWHLYLGFLSVLFSIITILITIQILFQVNFANASAFGPPQYLIITKLIIDLLIIAQFVIAYRENKKMSNLNLK